MVASVDRSAALAEDGLREDQLLHFAEHGWVLIEGVLSETECATYIDHMERCMASVEHPVTSSFYAGRDVLAPYAYDQFFFKWFKVPGVLNAYRQLIGAPIRLENQRAVNNEPHSERHSKGSELRDWTTWKWHRRFRAKWGIFTDDSDPRFVNSIAITSATYLTAASAENGSTAFLDGSHRDNGSIPPLGDGSEIIQPTIPAGSIVLFSESLWHTTVPILSEDPRYLLLNFVSASWLATDSTFHVPLVYADRLADEELREIFSPPTGADVIGSGHAARRAAPANPSPSG